MLISIRKEVRPMFPSRPWNLFSDGRLFQNYKSRKSALDNLDAIFGKGKPMNTFFSPGPDPVWNKGTPMPEDYTCSCGIYVHPTRVNPTAIHTKDCPYRGRYVLDLAPAAGKPK